ncbi:hypothetical protein HELRODRAFT_160118 [Helobdella robusta]|uniref:Uncharacterized protein n=1 Tax=Helobdella robusta TaxID=6412 RepID=T1EPU0_HELRO|nr:hypothetical protein HELRODRAFT_160118 [Helobdella robusta]ESO06011.1 hypothetical protein HELRODRAFT_160118 [Helobdella robusta]
MPKSETILIGGDVGRKTDGFEHVHGGFSYGKRNEDGNRILEFVEKENWPKMSNTAGEPAKRLHEWCGKMSQLLSSLTDRVKRLEAKDEKNLLEIERLKTDLESAKKGSKTLYQC